MNSMINKPASWFNWLDNIKLWLHQNFDAFWVEILVVAINFLSLIIFIVVIDVLVRKVLDPLISAVVKRTKLNWDSVFYDNQVFKSLLHLIPISIMYNLLDSIFNNQQAAYVAERILLALLILIFVQLVFRIVDAFTEISKDDNNYTTIGIRTFGQLIKIVTIFMAVISLIAVMFNIAFGQILTVLGALTAVLILLFKDTILGFVSGLQISTTKMIKIGDWISVEKYNLEGYVRQINLTTAKIEKFDKTMAMVPTYDLISTNIVNYMPMVDTHTRRIKRAIIFNIKSFEFLTEQQLNEYKKITILDAYITKKLSGTTKTMPVKERLTNIGLFRKYTELYLQINPHISSIDTKMVRQLDISPQGLPLEIYCFATTSEWLEFEEVQSDIFDHLLTQAKQFNLEVMQTISV